MSGYSAESVGIFVAFMACWLINAILGDYMSDRYHKTNRVDWRAFVYSLIFGMIIVGGLWFGSIAIAERIVK